MKKVLSNALCFALIVSIFASCNKAEQPLNVAELLDLGEKYLLEMDYEQAVVQFLKVIEIEPMNPRGYTGAAEAYVGLGEVDKAISILRQGVDKLPNDGVLTVALKKLETVAEPPQELGPEVELNAEWLIAYEKIIGGDNETGRVYKNGGLTGMYEDANESYEGFSLVDFDSDGVPELVILVSEWEWDRADVYTYTDGLIQYMTLPPNLFKEISTDYYFSIYFDEGIFIPVVYKLEKGRFISIDGYAEVTYPGGFDFSDYSDENLEKMSIHLGEASYPINEFLVSFNEDLLWDKDGFIRFDYSAYSNFETALSTYLRQTN